MPAVQDGLLVALGRTIGLAHDLRCALARYYPAAG
jgi:hypothetical protein